MLGILPRTWDTWVNKIVQIPKGTLYITSFCVHLLTLRWVLQVFFYTADASYVLKLIKMEILISQLHWVTVHFSSFTQLCSTLCDPMACSTPGLPVHHQLPKFTQTHVYWVSDAIQPSHPLLSPSPPASIFPSVRVFSNESVLHIRWPKSSKSKNFRNS